MQDERHYLSRLIEPQSVAIVGADEQPGAPGETLARNMLDAGYAGRLFFVHPRRTTVFGQACHRALEAIPQRLDVAVLCVPATETPALIEECGRAGVRHVIVVAGEVGGDEQGRRLERTLAESARRHRIRLLGPDCLGLARPVAKVSLLGTPSVVRPGTLGLVSQSGALCSAILDWAQPNNIGFSAVVSVGREADIDFGEILDYLVADGRTENIFLYIERIRNARRFMSALRAAARCKPVLLIKVGRQPETDGGSATALAADAVFDAALRRCGVVRLDTVGQMYAAAEALFAHFRPRGHRLAIVSNGGGPAVMAADAASDLGIPLARLSETTIARLRDRLPATTEFTNPLDLLGDADPERYGEALAACLADDGIDGVLTLLTPQAATDPTQTARRVIELARSHDKPLIACWMGEERVDEGRRLFKGAGIPVFRTPEPAVALFGHISAYYRNQQLLMQAPAALADHAAPRLESARLVIETALAEGRRALNEMESKALLAAFRIPIAQTVIARSLSEAMVLAEEIGLPVVMKIDSPQIQHKADAGGVRLNLETLAQVRDAYAAMLEEVKRKRPDAIVHGVAIEPMIRKVHGRELTVGMARDAVFGPVIFFGASGDEAQARRAVALPPLNRFLIADLLASTEITARLGASRSMPPVDLEALTAVLLRVSEMICELPWIREMAIDPLIVDEQGAVAVDARILIENLPLTAGRYDHMAIHPYPSHLRTQFVTADGQTVEIRPIRPEDAQIEQEFVRRLSPETKYLRFMNTIRELSQAQLIRLTQIDYDREMAFIAVIDEDGAEREVGVARYATNPDGESCEFAIVVADDWQGKGLARRLMQVLIDTAAQRGLKYMNGDFLAENDRMLRFVGQLGFHVTAHPEDPGLRRGVLELA